MDNLDKLLKRIENNYVNKDKREKHELVIKDHTYEVVTLTRSERFDLFFSQTINSKDAREVYKWLKPFIYKSLQLKDLAIKAKEEGYINSYLEVVDMLFETNEIQTIIEFILKINNLGKIKYEAIEAQKKQ